MALYNPNKAVQGIADYKAKWANAKAKGEDTTAYEQGAKAYYEELRNNGRGDIADHLEKSDAVQAGEYLKTLTPDYQATAGDLQGKSNEAYKWITDTANQLDKDYDMVYQTIGVTPTRTDYGKDILGGYGVAADEVYKGTLGGASGDNGGNVDSYAAAQANRNKAAMVKEGYGTVLDYYNSIAGNATKWAGDKANALGGFAGLMQGNVTDDRDTVEKAFTGTVDLWKTQDTNKTEKDIADVSAELTREELANEKLIADEKNATDIYVQQLKNAKSGSGTSGSGEKFDAGKTVDGIISRYTEDKLTLVDADNGKYEKVGTVIDKASAAADIQAILDDTSISEAERTAVYKEARLKGIPVSMPAVVEGSIDAKYITVGSTMYNQVLSDLKNDPDKETTLAGLKQLGLPAATYNAMKKALGL